MTTEAEETTRKKFSNWLQCVNSLNDTKTALHDHVLEKFKKEILSWDKDLRDDIPLFLTCVAKNRIKVGSSKKTKSKNPSKKREWYCHCNDSSCNRILKQILALQQSPNFKIVWNSALCESHAKSDVEVESNDELQIENIPKVEKPLIWLLLMQLFELTVAFTSKLVGYTSPTEHWKRTPQHSPGADFIMIEYEDIFDGCTEAHIWCIANMFMQHGKAKTNISSTGPKDTDASMFFKMMKNCKLFEIENENYLYDDVLTCRDKLHHCPNNRLDQREAETYFQYLISLLEKFEHVPECARAKEIINMKLRETVLSVAVPDESLETLARNVLKLKKYALEVDKETENVNGLNDESTSSLIEDTEKELANLEDQQNPLNYASKSREDYKRENEEYKRGANASREEIKLLKNRNEKLELQLKEQTQTRELDQQETDELKQLHECRQEQTNADYKTENQNLKENMKDPGKLTVKLLLALNQNPGILTHTVVSPETAEQVNPFLQKLLQEECATNNQEELFTGTEKDVNGHNTNSCDNNINDETEELQEENRGKMSLDQVLPDESPVKHSEEFCNQERKSQKPRIERSENKLKSDDEMELLQQEAVEKLARKNYSEVVSKLKEVLKAKAENVSGKENNSSVRNEIKTTRYQGSEDNKTDKACIESFESDLEPQEVLKENAENVSGQENNGSSRNEIKTKSCHDSENQKAVRELDCSASSAETNAKNKKYSEVVSEIEEVLRAKTENVSGKENNSSVRNEIKTTSYQDSEDNKTDKACIESFESDLEPQEVLEENAENVSGQENNGSLRNEIKTKSYHDSEVQKAVRVIDCSASSAETNILVHSSEQHTDQSNLTVDTTKSDIILYSRSDQKSDIKRNGHSKRVCCLGDLHPDTCFCASHTNVNIEATLDGPSCGIFGSCYLPSGEILLADNDNNKLKKLDDNYQVVDWIVLPYSRPQDVCYIGNNEVVVALDKKKIQFVGVQDKMTPGKTLDTEYQIRGLTCHGNHLYAISEKCVYLYDTYGTKQRVLYTHQSGNIELEPLLRHIAVSDDGSKIYVTCLHTGLVTIDSSGMHLYTFTDPDLERACGICLDDNGLIWVCDKSSNNVLLISSDGKQKLRMLDNSSTNINNSETLCFDRNKSALISAGNSVNVTVLKLK